MRILLVVVAILLVPGAARASDDEFFLVAHGSYGFGRNVLPEHDVARSTVSLPTVGAGIGSGMSQLLWVATPILGHDDGTSSELVTGVSLRIAPEKLGGGFGRMAIEVSPGSTERDGETQRSVTFGLHGGFAVGLEEHDLALSVGPRLGETRDDGFLAIVELRVGYAYRWRVGGDAR